ncbi:MAG: ion transporter [Chromatiales bacterium]|nr:ion transporter [Chromatiales bacterium]
MPKPGAVLLYIRILLDDTGSTLGRRFALFIQALILLSLLAFSVETLPNLSETTRQALWLVELLTVAVFTVEYLLRVLTAERPLRFIFSFYGLVDLLAILPFYLSSGLDTRTVRILRMLRLIRIFKLLRYQRAVAHYIRAFRLVREELAIFTLVSAMLLFLSAVGIYYFEHEAQPEVFASVFHSLWWAVATLTTVGYGDIYPVTAGGRIFTFFVLTVGLGVVAVPTGLVAAALAQARKSDGESGDQG